MKKIVFLLAKFGGFHTLYMPGNEQNQINGPKCGAKQNTPGAQMPPLSRTAYFDDGNYANVLSIGVFTPQLPTNGKIAPIYGIMRIGSWI